MNFYRQYRNIQRIITYNNLFFPQKIPKTTHANIYKHNKFAFPPIPDFFMGNQQPTFSHKLAHKYDFISYQNNPTLGAIKIYRKRQPFYNYLMVLDRWVEQGDIEKHTEQLRVIDERQKGENEAMMLKIFGKEVVEGSVSDCGRKVQYKMYVEYLNYSLKNLIEHRNQHYAKFTKDQVIYVLISILQTHKFFTSIEATQCTFHSQQIFLTPQGQVKFNPLQIFPKQTLEEADCVESNCMPVRFKKTLRIQDKLVVYEIKKIVGEMTELSDFRGAEDMELFALRKRIGGCGSVKEVEEILVGMKEGVERLEFNPKKIVGSEENTTKGLSVSNSSKISVKYLKR